MRGKVAVREFYLLDGGITPAYAGKRCRTSRAARSSWDHPRMCGEKKKVQKMQAGPRGSPPHVRGKEVHVRRWQADSGITPAYAGKSSPGLSDMHANGDHPRMCGEKARTLIVEDEPQGSPPHVRGKAPQGSGSSRARGITPACAGKSLKRSCSTVPPVAIVPLFPSVCNKPVVSDGSPAGRDAPLFLPAENAVPASPAYNLRSL